MSRSLKKGPFVDEKLYRKVEKLNENRRREPVKTWARRCTIVPEFVGHTFKVHNGKTFNDVFVTEDMVGHKLGEFSQTRTFRGHTNKKEGIEGGEKGAAAAPAPKK
jgi:small subunit ribosomal protein S19